ncbi:MAG: T9SS type A sorting domain-containing protein [Flavobacteriales bacterium]
MATAFLAVGQKADGQVVYTDVDPDAVLMNGVFDVDFDGDGTTDVSIEQITATTSSGGTAAVNANVPAGNAVIGSLSSSYMYPSILANGDPIAPGAPNFQTAAFGTMAIVYNGSNSFGFWNASSGFLGCRFVDGGGQTHYGWVEVAVSNGATSATVIGYGYETTADSAITAGDMGPLGIGPSGAASINFAVAPNPAQTLTSVSFTTAEASVVQVSVINGMGQVLLAERRNAVPGSNIFPLDLTTLAEGTYFVRLQAGNQVAFRKVTKAD